MPDIYIQPSRPPKKGTETTITDAEGESPAVIQPGEEVETGDGGHLIAGKDPDGKGAIIGATGVENDSLKVVDEHSYLLKEILTCQKKIVQHLELLTEVEIEDHNVEK